MEQLKESELKYLIALHKALNITPRRFKILFKYFGNEWKRAFTSLPKELRETGLDAKSIEKLLANRKNIYPNKILDELNRYNIQVLIQGHKNFPIQLENIPSSPVLLFCRGKLKETDFPCIAAVGSRKISTYGKRVIEEIIGGIANMGVTIVSGLAIGTDTYVHKTTIKNGSRTICVLGSPINEIYPSQNKEFATQIIKEDRGVILSEYLPGEQIRPENFPIRNRIISGLAKSLIVIEATEKSGSLITARIANEQGREIFSVPGEIFSTNSKGTNDLLLKGEAHPAISATQIMEFSGLKNFSEKQTAKTEISTSGIESDLCRVFDVESKLHINELISKTGFSSSVVISNLVLLEIKGLVVHLGNQMYARVF